MGVDPMSRRAEGVSPLSQKDLEGSRGRPDGDTSAGVNLPTATYENPGPTPNIRGIEPNTNWGWESTGEPMIQVTTAGEMPVSAVLSPPFSVPQDALGDVEGPAPDGWTTADSSAMNSKPPEPQVGSFTKFGEKYPGSGGLDG
jgi:hypothetical protein